jgi:hypothetical protein
MSKSGCSGEILQWKQYRGEDFMKGSDKVRINKVTPAKGVYQYLFHKSRGNGNWGPIQDTYARSFFYLQPSNSVGVIYRPYNPNYPYEPYSVDTFYNALPRSEWDSRC